MRSTWVAVLTILLIVGSEYTVLAAIEDHATPSNGTEARAVGEARGDWFNQIGFPQQFFGAQLAWFNVGFYFMLAFLKVFLLMGIWPVFNEKYEEEPTVYNGISGYGHNHVYYSIPSWPTYG
ncbi:uncharacterized protein LOC110675399 isoform X2 [Aedes aegypti]|uniref:Uncharacterized protein n=1 Tax=Aedes aegypti TaxID=7159 RepID=A0A6I8U0P9_AEDAE|nr:uncharacterized protein LOC110675399 isoform X2 [Aedes aegypti]